MPLLVKAHRHLLGRALFVPEGLVVWHNYRDGVATDKTGNGHDGVVTGAAYTEDGLEFDGNDLVTIPCDEDQLVIGTGPFQFHVWFRATAGTEGLIMSKDAEDLFGLTVDEIGAVGMALKPGFGYIYDDSRDWRDGEFHFVTTARVGDAMRGWIDGAPWNGGEDPTAGLDAAACGHDLIIGNKVGGVYGLTGAVAAWMFDRDATKTFADIAAEHQTLFVQGVT